MVQNFEEENIDEFDEFLVIRQYFSYQNFPLVNVVHSPYDIRRTFLSPGSYIPLIEV